MLATLIVATAILPPMSAPERPRDAWVFRSTLDSRPRMATVALSRNLWVAYDATTCGFYKAWKNGVSFDPFGQASTVGSAYLAGDLSTTTWSVRTANSVTPIQPKWKGYRIQKGQVSFTFEFLVGTQKVTVRETPEVVFNSSKEIGLDRSFTVENLPKSAILLLSTPMSDEAGKVITNGALLESSGAVGGQLTKTLVLKQTGTTFIRTYLKPNLEVVKSEKTAKSVKILGRTTLANGEVLTTKSDGEILRTGKPRTPEKKIAFGLNDPRAIRVVVGEIFVLQAQELTQLIDLDKDGVIDDYLCVADGWSITPNASEFAGGLAFKDGSFYASLSTATDAEGRPFKSQSADRGSIIRIEKNGAVEVVASGLTAPSSIAVGAKGEIFFIDGPGLFRLENAATPLAWLPGEPQTEITQLPSGQFLFGNSLRVALESGNGSAVLSTQPKTKLAFEMQSVLAKTNGLEIILSESLAEGMGRRPSDYEAKQWRFAAGAKLDETSLPIQSVTLNQWRNRVFLEIPGIKPGHVVQVQPNQGLLSTSNQLISTERAWYTMNQVPTNKVIAPNPEPILVNKLTPQEVKEGFQLLFDGKSLDSFRGFKSPIPSPAWSATEDQIAFTPGPEGGDLITRDQFADFDLRLEWKISPGGNSGILYRVTEDFANAWETGPEMQILDNKEHPDGANPKTSAGANYGLYAPKVNPLREVGEWNEVRILVVNNVVTYYLNGAKVVKHVLGSVNWKPVVLATKFADMPGYGKNKSGHIALQDHGNKVWFRNLRIKRIR